MVYATIRLTRPLGCCDGHRNISDGPPRPKVTVSLNDKTGCIKTMLKKPGLYEYMNLVRFKKQTRIVYSGDD